MKIVILDGYAANPGDLDYHLLEKLGEVVVYPRTSDAEKVERAKDADIILLNKVQIDAETLAQLPKLKYIGIQATGFNVVDIEADRSSSQVQGEGRQHPGERHRDSSPSCRIHEGREEEHPDDQGLRCLQELPDERIVFQSYGSSEQEEPIVFQTNQKK